MGKDDNNIMRKVMVAMSGGVDSSVAAYLVKEEGYDVTGVTLRLYDGEKGSFAKSGLPPYPAEAVSSAVEDAKCVADSLGIPHLVFDLRDEFKQRVIDSFVKAYESGLTPNPCIECNRYLKFEKILLCGDKSENACVATGHYAMIERDSGSERFLLRKAVDLNKDQTYVLCRLTQDQLARTMFPLGKITKEEALLIAKEQDFTTASKSDSQDICFIPDGDYAGFICRYRDKTYPCGKFTDKRGNSLGDHRGIIRYTVGQRKGLGIALGKPAYVCSIDPESNTVVLGDNEDLFTRELEAVDFNWIATDTPSGDIRAKARIRYKHKEAYATVVPTGRDTVKVIFDEPQRAVTGGQSVVLYDGDIVIGGGTIV